MNTTTHTSAPASLYTRDNTAHALGLLIRTTARILLTALIWWLFTTEATHLAWWQWAIATSGIPLAYLSLPPHTAKD